MTEKSLFFKDLLRWTHTDSQLLTAERKIYQQGEMKLFGLTGLFVSFRTHKMLFMIHVCL